MISWLVFYISTFSITLHIYKNSPLNKHPGALAMSLKDKRRTFHLWFKKWKILVQKVQTQPVLRKAGTEVRLIPPLSKLLVGLMKLSSRLLHNFPQVEIGWRLKIFLEKRNKQPKSHAWQLRLSGGTYWHLPWKSTVFH